MQILNEFVRQSALCRKKIYTHLCDGENYVCQTENETTLTI